MGTTKTQGFSVLIVQMSDVLKALGHPARIEILSFIKSNPNTTCMQIVVNMSLSQSTISKHLSELKKVKILEKKRILNSDSYNINYEVLNQSKIFVEQFLYDKKIKKVASVSKTKSKNFEPEIKKNIEIPKLEIITVKPKINPNRKKSEINLKKFNYVFKNKKD